MSINRFAEDRQDAFWIVGTGQTLRHATTMRPGAVYSGQVVPALCEHEVKIPQPTPLGREPQTKNIAEKCLDCEQLIADGNFAEITWDF
ncbi:hypothetical protein QFW96_27325 [Saccharopolyspora sp. TS4A08]|uniref:Uncharacterized protein n=1 Tax=Saccharopolyspora ipomoeae TaxID=3042027 RepID=A0ABT6PWM5_9PSEU|nr:hypothetical protein [Saccharopolyspora sp. TS4A08]MDI2032361.1 hypothetical protein [Saccharopolyspora sp. TS4A08]